MTPAMAGAVPVRVDALSGMVGGWAWDKVADGITGWVLEAVGYFVEGVVGFLLTSARPDVTAVWFAGSGSPYATVRNIAGVGLVGFVFLGLVQGLILGDPAAMLRRVTFDLPAAVAGMVATTVVVGTLLDLTDALSATVLASSGGQAGQFLSGFGVAVNGATHGFAAVLLGLVAVLAAFFLWVELMVRSVLVYVLVAVSPLSFAAMVWPSARGVLRRTVELLVAVVLSKLAISIALTVGVAALAGAGTAGQPTASWGGANAAATSLGVLLTGGAVLALAAFAPFLVLRLIPLAEGAVVAYGVSRAPMRAAQSTAGNVAMISSVSRLAGGGPGGGMSAGGGMSSAGGAAGGDGGSGAGPDAARFGGAATAAHAAAGGRSASGPPTGGTTTAGNSTTGSRAPSAARPAPTPQQTGEPGGERP